jgi:hypothetical protein
MNFRKNSTLIIGCAVASALLVIALIFLIKNQSSYKANVMDLEAARGRLNALNNRNPFPSSENVTLTSNNLEVLKSKFTSIQGSLLDNQLKAETIEPARFAPLLEEAIRRVRNRAITNNIITPAESGLGFKEYAAGKLPPNDPKVMERLIIQVKALEDIISLLIDSNIAAIDLLQRDDFETKLSGTSAEAVPDDGGRRGFAIGREQVQDARSAPGSIPLAPVNPLYETERFTIGFSGRESAVWEVLNRFVSSKITYVIKDITFESTATNLGKPVDMKSKFAALLAGSRQPAATPSTASAIQSLESISREERVVGGRELIKVRIVLDMYRFKDLAGAEVQP